MGIHVELPGETPRKTIASVEFLETFIGKFLEVKFLEFRVYFRAICYRISEGLPVGIPGVTSC